MTANKINAKQDHRILISKIAMLLSHLNSNGKGSRLKNLVLETGMAHSTVHRILSDLREVGFVTQDKDKTYQLGPALFTLGLSAPSPIQDMILLREYANQLAQKTSEIVYVSIKQLNGVRYIIACRGNSPILPNTIQQGDFKPFTTSYSGLVLMAYLDEEQQRILIQKLKLDASPSWVNENRFQLQRQIPHLLKQIKQDNYLYGENLVLPGVSGISTIIPSKNSPIPYMTVSLSAISERLQPDRANQLIPELLETAKKMSELIY